MSSSTNTSPSGKTDTVVGLSYGSKNTSASDGPLMGMFGNLQYYYAREHLPQPSPTQSRAVRAYYAAPRSIEELDRQQGPHWTSKFPLYNPLFQSYLYSDNVLEHYFVYGAFALSAAVAHKSLRFRYYISRIVNEKNPVKMRFMALKWGLPLRRMRLAYSNASIGSNPILGSFGIAGVAMGLVALKNVVIKGDKIDYLGLNHTKVERRAQQDRISVEDAIEMIAGEEADRVRKLSSFDLWWRDAVGNTTVVPVVDETAYPEGSVWREQARKAGSLEEVNLVNKQRILDAQRETARKEEEEKENIQRKKKFEEMWSDLLKKAGIDPNSANPTNTTSGTPLPPSTSPPQVTKPNNDTLQPVTMSDKSFVVVESSSSSDIAKNLKKDTTAG